MHDDLYQYLTTNGAVTSLFGDRVFHMSLPKNVKTWPALTFQMVSYAELAEDMEAPNDDKLEAMTYQFEVIADSSGEAVSKAKTFDSIFRNFRGTMGGVKVQHVMLSNSTQIDDRDGDMLRRRVILDYSITFEP